MNTQFEVNKEKTTTTWLTPPSLIKKLGDFDLDPCAAINQPWATAKTHFTEKEDGLSQEWFGRVWMNPPYGRKEMPKWLKKMAQHNRGIALTFNRSETEQFFDYVWPVASGIFFLKGRIKFLDITGAEAGSPGCGSVLISYGKEDAETLKYCENMKILSGKFLPLNC